MQQFLVRLISYSLTFRCWGSTAVVLLVFSKFCGFLQHCYEKNGSHAFVMLSEVFEDLVVFITFLLQRCLMKAFGQMSQLCTSFIMYHFLFQVYLLHMNRYSRMEGLAFYKLLILNQVFNQFSYSKGCQLDLENLETS